MKPLDFVRTPKGAIAIVTEMNYPPQDGMPNEFSISFLGGGNPSSEKNSWWYEDEGLEVIDNLPSLLARNIAHPFGSGKKPAIDTYPIR